ncbi:binding-protein-dependent transport systems inner membrane component [Xylanimonas cellulosilytica DSM 15894]|uniref:Binding-protein-dependent transport systems inner membrane component n=1 Tax=Xylanimonas cellulosilytica (strain DSM 15894 / JCM 12276 / CECT 5975 / KCTC 9989 / LMG 20990 / NBRC 107835 / XIL07) TaxID=446471 RepID=D1BT27_XYLCX|nr:ABC transporter permease [Xylanimonas cellulosilytica]ACZ30869.1 binding-protein-dependent transport systems inner membrane component [Xylanimonas cellulosilytica DSM 15894]
MRPRGASPWRRLLRRPTAVVSLAFLAVVVTVAVGATVLGVVDPTAQNLTAVNQPPGGAHLLGTDGFGRDLLARLLVGVRVSLTIAFFAGLLDLTIGVTYGLVAGLAGPRVDAAMQRALEVLGGIPTLVVLVLMLMVLPPGMVSIVLAMALTGWIPMARLMRAQALRLKEQEFMLAARVLGAGRPRLAVRHLLPNSVGLIVVQTMFTIPTAIFFEAFLSFIGLGLRPPAASLGTLLSTGFQTMTFLPHQLLVPAITLSAIMVAFNLLADGLRDAFDPRGVTRR